MLTAASSAAPVAQSAAAPASTVPSAPAGWKTVFGDGFAGRAGSAPSSANWFYDIGTGYGTGEIEQTTNSTKNVYLDGDGHLVLKATRSRAPGPRRGSSPPATTSRRQPAASSR